MSLLSVEQLCQSATYSNTVLEAATLSHNFHEETQSRPTMKFLAFYLFAICVLPNNNEVEGFVKKGYKSISIPSPPTIVQPPQCSSPCSPCPAPPAPPQVQCPPVQCPQVHCPPVQCPTVNCPTVQCPTVICPALQIDDGNNDDEVCHCNPETPLSPVSFPFVKL